MGSVHFVVGAPWTDRHITVVSYGEQCHGFGHGIFWSGVAVLVLSVDGGYGITGACTDKNYGFSFSFTGGRYNGGCPGYAENGLYPKWGYEVKRIEAKGETLNE